MWKRAGVSEEKMARLALSLDQENVQEQRNHAVAEVQGDTGVLRTWSGPISIEL